MGPAQIKMTVRWRLRNLPGIFPVVMYAKFVPICLRQRLAGGYGYINRDQGLLPVEAAIFASFD